MTSLSSSTASSAGVQFVRRSCFFSDGKERNQSAINQSFVRSSFARSHRPYSSTDGAHDNDDGDELFRVLRIHHLVPFVSVHISARSSSLLPQPERQRPPSGPRAPAPLPLGMSPPLPIAPIPLSGSMNVTLPTKQTGLLLVADQEQRFQIAQELIGAPVLGQFDGGTAKIAVVCSCLASERLEDVNASAVDPAIPERILSLYRRRIFLAVCLITDSPSLTCPSPARYAAATAYCQNRRRTNQSLPSHERCLVMTAGYYACRHVRTRLVGALPASFGNRIADYRCDLTDLVLTP